MWSTVAENGKIKYRERYTDPLSGKKKTVCITMDKDTASNRKKAAEELVRLINERTTSVEVSNITLCELKECYINYQKKTVKQSTWVRNEITLNTLCTLLGDDSLVDNLTAAYVRDKLLDTSKEPGTLNEYIKRLKAMLNWAYASDYTDNAKLIKKLVRFKDKPHREKIQDKYLEQEEVKSLLDGMKNEQWYYLTKFLILSGLRIGEAIALEDKDIDSDVHVTKTFDVVNNVITSPKTSYSIRDVYIQPELASCIKAYRLYRKKTSMENGIRSKHFFFDKKTGDYIAYHSFCKYLREVSERILGRKVTIHTLRHTHASLMLADGVPVDTISRRLGHENSKVTKEIYLHITKKLMENDNQIIQNTKIIS